MYENGVLKFERIHWNSRDRLMDGAGGEAGLYVPRPDSNNLKRAASLRLCISCRVSFVN
jgi:hypothetical protein